MHLPSYQTIIHIPLQIQFVITDSKLSLAEIGNMRSFLDRLQKAGENFDVAGLEAKTALVLRRNDELLKGVTAQKKTFQVGNRSI